MSYRTIQFSLQKTKFKRMQPVKKYNILIIGRSGSGKSATTKLLTSNPAIKVANSLKQVTTQVNYYNGTSFQIMGQFVQFHIFDIPGLDKINNRFLIREKLLNKLQEFNISLNAIIYVSSLTQRDTLDQNKLFQFLQQLPWGLEHKKQALIPILTKYDNLIIDSQEQDVQSIKKEYQQIFQKMNYTQAWGKRIYWINQTKSLQFKIKSYEQIRQKFDKQIQRLIEMIKKNKQLLTAKAIRQLMDQQIKYILHRLFVLKSINKISFNKVEKSHNVLLKIQIQPKNMEQNFTMFSASSIGIFISRVCQKQISSSFSIMLISIPIAITLLKLANESFVFHDKQIGQDTSKQTIIHSYERICEEINNEMQREWKELNNSLEFRVFKKYICCTVNSQNQYNFFDLANLSLKYEGIDFQRNKKEQGYEFKLQIPKFQQDTLWTPEIMVHYELKRYSEQELMKKIELIRKQFCSKI